MTASPNNPPTERKRLDQGLTEEAQTILQALLGRFPDLRTVAIVFDYHLDDAGSLPAGTLLSSRALTLSELLQACRQIDKLGLAVRSQHDLAVGKRMQELEQRIAALQQQLPQSKPPEDKLDGEGSEGQGQKDV
jgi:hypothetical protein